MSKGNIVYGKTVYNITAISKFNPVYREVHARRFSTISSRNKIQNILAVLAAL